MTAAAPGLLDRWPIMAAIVALSLLPILFVTTPPLVDYGGHMARFAVQLDRGASPDLRQWYSFDWALLPNLGTDLVMQALGPVLGLDAAGRVILALIVGLHVGGVLLLARAAHGRITGPALFALPLAYGLPFQYGFLNFTFTAGLALIALAGWVALGRSGNDRLRAILFVPIGFAIWVSHLSGYALFGVAAFACETMRGRDGGRAWLDAGWRAALAMLPLLTGPLVGLVVSHVFTHGVAPSSELSYARFGDKLIWPRQAFYDRWRAWDLASAAIAAIGIYWFWRSPRFVRHRGLAAGALLLTALYAIMPDTIMASSYADMRLVPFILTLFLVAAAPAPDCPARLQGHVLVAGLIFAAARLAGNATALQLHAAEFDRNLAVLDAVPRGANLVTLYLRECEPEDTWHFDRREHLSGYALLRRHAFDSRQWQIPGGQLLAISNPAAEPFAHSPLRMVFATRCYDELTLQSALPLISPAIRYVWVLAYPARAPTPGWTVIRAAGDSVILHRRP